ncbi:MAG: hypothetical protein KIT83_19015 [Bryobacterales bacterium]|nr:hypothetical protein [Bryobacterales bacterium]
MEPNTLDTRFPLCVGDVPVCVGQVPVLLMFSVLCVLPSTISALRAICSRSLFGSFTGTTTPHIQIRLADSSATYTPAVRLSPSLGGLPLFPRSVIAEVSRFSCMQFPGVHGVCNYVGSPPGSR